MGGTGLKRGVVGVAAAVLTAATLAAVGTTTASGEALSPWWGVTSGSRPTNLVSGGTGRIVVTAENRGDAPTSGEVTISDVLPAGLEAVGIEGVAGERPGLHGNRGAVSCVLGTLTCTFSGSLHSYEDIEVDISVSVQGAFSGEQNTASVSGGGAASPVPASHAIEVDGSEKFGVEDFQLIAENAGGFLDTQAGSHPFQLTSVVTLNTATPEPGGGPQAVALPKDISPELPAGLIANPTGLAQCTEAQFNASAAGGNECPPQTAVGVATVTFNTSKVLGLDTATAPIFNMTPSRGEPARFGVKALGVLSAFLETAIRSGGDYGVTLTSHNITEEAWLLSLRLTFWGVPGDPRHDGQRGWKCLEGSGTCTPSTVGTPPPFLSLGSACGEPLLSTVEGDSWQQEFEQPGHRYPLASYTMEALDGCDELPFDPEISVAPDLADASAPSGLNVDLHVPQTVATNPKSLAESSVRDIKVTLPAGVAVNPAAADGLEACSESQIGFTGFGELHPVSEPGVQSALFTPGLPEPFCPNGAKVGTVKIKTPLLANPLEGAVYLAAQNANPFGSLVAVYVVAEEPISGVLVKLPGEVTLNQETGQVAVTFEGTPQLPFEDIELAFFGGERALLATPAHCGRYETTASFVPWSAEPGDEAALTVHASSTFKIGTGPNGAGTSGCPSSPLPFAPALHASTTNLNAGAFSPLTVTVSRADGEQALQGFQLRLPPGLEGMLSSVPLCPEAQANAGTCPAASQIGETTVAAGLGADPYILSGGKVYLTGKYEGAPFGLAIVTPARVGPFTLQEGRPIVIRAKFEIDPATAALTITTGLGVGGIPSIIEGFPLQIQHLNITIDRSGFIFNPTNCSPLSITGTIGGGEGASAAVSSSFHVANCATLKFNPKLSASTEGHAGALKGGTGASLNVEIASRGGPGVSGEEANIKRVDLTLPRLLPARLQPTLQNACTKARFAKDPASCPPDSFVGTATAVTPVFNVPLRGPAIFVSRGGAALPDLDLVLQGEGVEILLTGHTEIKGGVTYAKFETFPDVPISSLALSLPEGPHSALASGLPTNERSLCGQSLQMGTTIEGQNGAVVKQTTRVRIEGCKPALYIRSTKVSGESVTVTVTVPSAGRIVASGAGLRGQTKHPGGEKLVTLKLTLSGAEAARVAKGHGVRTKVRLVFTPRRGRRLAKVFSVRFAK